MDDPLGPAPGFPRTARRSGNVPGGLVAVIAAVLAVAPPLALAERPAVRVDRPLGVDTPGTLRQLVLDMPLADARPGGVELDARWSMANDWSVPTRLQRGAQQVDVQLDEQADRLAVSARLPWARLGAEGGLGERLETTVAWHVITHWGGYTDGLIDGWHRFGRYGTFGRLEHGRDAVSVHVGVPGGARLVDLDGPKFAVGDLVARTSLRIAEGARASGPWALAVRLDLKAPLGRPADAGGSGGADAGLGLAASVPLSPWLTAHAQAAVRRVASLPGAVPLRLNPWQAGAEVSLVAWRGDWALALEDRWLSALFEDGWSVVGRPVRGDAVTALLRAQNQITVGLRWRALTFWLSEDWTPGARRTVGWRWFYNTNAPDLVLGLSVLKPL